MSSDKPKTIRERLITIVNHTTDEARRFKSLEEATHISAATWRTFWNRSGSPSGEMIDAVSAAWPQFAFWLATGISDAENGHIEPGGHELTATTSYFLALLQQSRKGIGSPIKQIFEEIDALHSATPADWEQARLEKGDVSLDLRNLSVVADRARDIAIQRRLEELRENRDKERTHQNKSEVS